MADEADCAYEYTEKLLQHPTNPFSFLPSVQPRGTCHYCEAEVEHPKLFCDEDCAKDWTALMKARSLNRG